VTLDGVTIVQSLSAGQCSWTTLPHPAGSETILIVDDESVALEFCRLALTRAGYVVIAATSAKQALNFFQPNRSHIDLALIDVMMPVMNSLQLAHHVEKFDTDTRIVLTSGYAPGEIKRLVGPDAANYRSIWKPFEARALERMIRNVLDIPPEKLTAKAQTSSS
jgi:two-component system, cell cycle sensor histidine kinase and response regulator CckA